MIAAAGFELVVYMNRRDRRTACRSRSPVRSAWHLVHTSCIFSRRCCQVNIPCTLRVTSACLYLIADLRQFWPWLSVFAQIVKHHHVELGRTAGRSVQLMRSPTSWVTPWVRVAPMWQLAQDGAAV